MGEAGHHLDSFLVWASLDSFFSQVRCVVGKAGHHLDSFLVWASLYSIFIK